MKVIRAILCSALILLGMAQSVFALEPVLYRVADPVKPGDTLLLSGGHLGEVQQVVLKGPAPLGEKSSSVATIIKRNNSALFVQIPREWPRSILRGALQWPRGEIPFFVNGPDVWWLQGNLGRAASPGGSVRLLGKNLDLTADLSGQSVMILQPLGDTGERATTAHVEGSCSMYSCRFNLPESLIEGKYRVLLELAGGTGSVAIQQSLSVVRQVKIPSLQVSVADFGAVGNGRKDDTAAIQDGLEYLAKNGGGTLFLPKGRYQLREGLKIPPFTRLLGSGRRQTSLSWSLPVHPPFALLRGTSHFQIESLSINANNQQHVIAGNLGDRSDSGHVLLRDLRIRVNSYAGHLRVGEVDKRLRQSLALSTGGGDTVRLGGENVTIVNCDLYGSGRSLFLSQVRGGQVSGNTLYNGRWGWYSLSGSDGLIFENNQIIGADLMATGGGVNCLDGSTSSRHIFFADNRIRLLHGWDRESMTSDGGGGYYSGKVEMVSPVRVRLNHALKLTTGQLEGAGFFIVKGRGQGQYRRITANEGEMVVLDSAFDIGPDQKSTVVITMFQGQSLYIRNHIVDAGPFQFYGTAVDSIVAGNTGERMGGFIAQGFHYGGLQPSWYNQFIDNRIIEGNYFDQGRVKSASIELIGENSGGDGALCRAMVVRESKLEENSHIRVRGDCRNILVENNRIRNSDVGIVVDRSASETLVRENLFEQVQHPHLDELGLQELALDPFRALLGQSDPIAAWDFQERKGEGYSDRSGNHFLAKIIGTREGSNTGQDDAGGRTGEGRYFQVDGGGIFNSRKLSLSIWVTPDSVEGRAGIVAKRINNTPAPFVLTRAGKTLEFGAADAAGSWPFVLRIADVFTLGKRVHLGMVLSGGHVQVYVNGVLAAEKKVDRERVGNDAPLVFGREAWGGGDPPSGELPAFFIGSFEAVRIWARPLSAREMHTEFEVGPVGVHQNVSVHSDPANKEKKGFVESR